MLIINKMNEIKKKIEYEKKSIKWKIRSKIGKHKAWRRQVEEQE